MELKENCGITGVYGNKKAAEIIHSALFSLQHRGQESCGIITGSGKNHSSAMGMGLVSDVFKPACMKTLRGHFGIGHVRYSTTGSSSPKNIQPFIAEYRGKTYAISHNGNLVNSTSLRRSLEKRGSIFRTSLDTEIIMHMIMMSRKESFIEKILDVLPEIKGALSLVFFSPEGIVAAKDPWSFRPLCLGKLEEGYMVASESCAFDFAGASYIRELEPGEVLVIDGKGIKSILPEKRVRTARCIFEFIYFARPDSRVFGESVYHARKKLGENLAKEFPHTGEMVIPIPDSGSISAIGFSQKKGLPFEMGIVRNHYVGRTFIQPLQESREKSVRIKLNPIKEVIGGKDIVVIEDSIVRGTTSRMRITDLRKSGAKKIYMGVSCPPIRHPCFYGIDFPDSRQLIAGKKSVKEIEKEIGVDGLIYLSMESMLASIRLPREEFCTACFTGEYPVPCGSQARLKKERFETGRRGKE